MIWQRDATGRALPIDQPKDRALGYRAAKFKKDHCEGKARRHHPELHVHHINQDRTDNREVNLLTLCRWCHAKAHGKRPQQMGWRRRG